MTAGPDPTLGQAVQVMWGDDLYARAVVLGVDSGHVTYAPIIRTGPPERVPREHVATCDLDALAGLGAGRLTGAGLLRETHRHARRLRDVLRAAEEAEAAALRDVARAALPDWTWQTATVPDLAPYVGTHRPGGYVVALEPRHAAPRRMTWRAWAEVRCSGRDGLEVVAATGENMGLALRALHRALVSAEKRRRRRDLRLDASRAAAAVWSMVCDLERGGQ